MFQFFNGSSAKLRHALLILAVLLVSGCGSPEDRAQSHYERGMKLLSEQDPVRASVELRNAVRLKKDLAGAWLGLAQIEERNQNWPAVAAILRTVLEIQPKDIETTLRLARLMLLGGAMDEALKLSNAASDLDSLNASALALRAAILFKLDDRLGAVRLAQTALEINPRSAEAMVVLAADRLARGDAAGALQILDREPAAHVKDLGIQLFKIKIFEQTGDLQQVEALLRKLIELYPEQPVFRRQLIKLYVDQKRPDDAEKELRATAAANPTNIEAGLDVIRFLHATKGPTAARQELVTRINAGGQVFPYQIALAEYEFAQGNIADSTKLLESLVSNAGSPQQVLTAQIKLAEIHLSGKKLDLAEQLISDVLRKDSRNTSGLKLRASIRMERGQLDAAITDLREALNDQPRSTELLLLLAVAYERSGSIELADKQFAEATRASNFDARVGLNYVAFLHRRGGIARAEDVLVELASRWPSNIEILSALAQVRLTRQNWIGAQEVAETIRRIGDSRGVADQILGAALSGRNRYDESIGVLQNAYAAAPGAVQPMVSLVGTLVRAQQVDRAVGFLETVLKSNPSSAEAHVLLGSIQLMKNAPDQALKSYMTAIEKQPKNIVGYRALAELYIRQKNNEAALKTIRAGLQAEPDSVILRLTLAGVMELTGDYEAAIAEYEHLLEKQPTSMIFANNLASLLSEHRTDKASLERAQTLATSLRKSQVPHFKDTLGWIHFQTGDFRSAVALLEEAASELPNLALVRYHLGMSYIATGQNEKAAEQFKKALDLAPDNAGLQEKIRAGLKKAGT